MNKRMNGGNWISLLIGSVIGSAAVLLYAPRPGKKTRAYLGDKVREGKDYVSTKGREFGDQILTYIDQGKDLLSDQKDRLRAAIDTSRKYIRSAGSRNGKPRKSKSKSKRQG